MANLIIEHLLPRIKAFCPEGTEITVKEIPIRATRVLYLLLIKHDFQITDVDSWAIQNIYPLFFKIYYFLEREKDKGTADVGKIRLLFCNGSNFVLNVHVGSNVLEECAELQQLDVYGYNDRMTRYVGRVENIDNVVQCLINRRKIF